MRADDVRPLLAFALALLGYGLAAGSGAALAFDGSWSLFRTLRDGSPFIAHGRWADWLPLWLVGNAARVWPGAPPHALAAVYGALLAAIPLGALAVCCRVLRGPWEPLRVWPALGILLAPLPGQWCVMSEATLVAQAGWALLACLAVGRAGDAATTAGLAALAAEMFFLHPSSAVLFALGAGVCVWRRRMGWGVALALLAGARLALSVAEATPYERAEVSGARVLYQWRAAVWGLPLGMMLGALGLAAVVLANARGRLSDARARVAVGVLGAAAAAAGVAWGIEPGRWGTLLDFRRFVLPMELALLAMAGWHWRTLARNPKLGRGVGRDALPWVAGACCVTLAAQALVWRGLLGRFETALAAERRAFVSREDLRWLQGTALDHWTSCPLSLFLQRDRPRSVFVLNREDVRGNGAAVQVTPWDVLRLPPPGSRAGP